MTRLFSTYQSEMDDATDHSALLNTTVHPSTLSLCTTATTLIFLPLAYVLLFITTLPGNILSLWVFHRRIGTVSPINVYFSHLSMSNLILSITTPFLAAYFAFGSVWTFKGFLCRLVLHVITPVMHINIYIGLMILTWVAFSRFATLVQHTHASRPSECLALLPAGLTTCLKKVSFAKGVCAAIWLLAVGSIVPVTVYYSVKEAISGNATAAEEDVCYNSIVEVGGSTSAAFNLSAIAIFYVCYVLVLLSYMTVLKHIRRSRHSASVVNSLRMLGRVLRNIVVIQMVLSVCLLPYHIFKPIFISLAHMHTEQMPDDGTNCHPLSALVEVKNSLLLLAALRGTTDPVMYFLLDKTFNEQTLKLFGIDPTVSGMRQCWSVTESVTPKTGQVGDGTRTTANSSHESAL